MDNFLDIDYSKPLLASAIGALKRTTQVIADTLSRILQGNMKAEVQFAPTDSNRTFSMGTWDKRHTLLVATGIINFLVLVYSPVLVEPPRLALQKRAIIMSAIIACFPLLWSFYLILFGRSRFTKVLALVNLPLAVAWVLGALNLIARAF